EQQVRGLVEEEVEQGRPEPGYDADDEAYQRPLGQVGGAGPARVAGGRCAQVSGEAPHTPERSQAAGARAIGVRPRPLRRSADPGHAQLRDALALHARDGEAVAVPLERVTLRGHAPELEGGEPARRLEADVLHVDLAAH